VIYVQMAEGKGRGVFAMGLLSAGDTIENAPVLVLSVVTNEIQKYAYQVDGEYECGSPYTEWWIGLGFASLYNHSHEPNAEFDYHEDTEIPVIEVRALKMIMPDEEITIDYTGEKIPWPLEGY
jgi:hypothetical protein